MAPEGSSAINRETVMALTRIDPPPADQLERVSAFRYQANVQTVLGLGVLRSVDNPYILYLTNGVTEEWYTFQHPWDIISLMESYCAGDYIRVACYTRRTAKG
jgi:hypothetical protein